ncbi:MAG: SRPBCC family protein [Pseudomonadota bacterium]
MQLVAHEDVEAPVEYVFEQVSDFATHERAALRRGADVQRADTLDVPGPGMRWNTRFDFRGKRRNVTFELVTFDPPTGLVIDSQSTNLGGRMVLDLVALSRLRTRISMRVDVTPRTLTARLFLQSLKLARVNPTLKFRDRVAGYATDLEERYKATA